MKLFSIPDHPNELLEVIDSDDSPCIHASNKIHAEWFDVNHECYNHRIQTLKYMITVKIYSRTKYNNRIEKRSNNLCRKLKITLNK